MRHTLFCFLGCDCIFLCCVEEQEVGWQRKFTRSRIPPRHEGRQTQPRFVDQFTKLHLWSMDREGFDWVFYMDSDIFIVRSIVPIIEEVFLLSSPYPSSPPGKTIWAIRDSGGNGFNMGMFMIQPSYAEFEELTCKLNETCSRSSNNSNALLYFPEDWMEQGFLNAIYDDRSSSNSHNKWQELHPTDAMNLATWSEDREAWRLNASKIQAIHFTVMKPWDWICPWTEYAPLCYLFWNKETLSFHRVF